MSSKPTLPATKLAAAVYAGISRRAEKGARAQAHGRPPLPDDKLVSEIKAVIGPAGITLGRSVEGVSET